MLFAKQAYPILMGVILLLLSAAAFSLERTDSEQIVLRSPDGKTQFRLTTNARQQLTYHVTYQSNVVLHRGQLGYTLDNRSFGTNVQKVELQSQKLINRSRALPYGSSTIPEHYYLYRLNVTDGSGAFTLVVRMYQQGVAFRYEASGTGSQQLQKELTSWSVDPKSQVWFFERPNEWKLKSYAGLWKTTQAENLDTISPTGPVQGKPLVYRLPSKLYVVITEAQLADYSGLRFRALRHGRLQADFTEGTAGFPVFDNWRSPWRATLFAHDLDALVNSPLIASLNPPPDPSLFPTTHWIKPGRAVWSWWSKDEAYLSLENEKRYISNAARLGFEYALIDDGWEDWDSPWETLSSLIDYAAERNVDIWIWKHSDELRTTAQLTQFLDKAVSSGAVGIKVDFMNSEARALIDFELDLLREAAKRKLMVNFHGCHASTGEYISYPNELTREGVRGNELNIMGRPIPAAHNAALPFTRFLTGPADFTPLAFSHPGNTTWTHQLVTAFLFDSPLFAMAEDPAFILDTPGLKSITPLLKRLPVVWDETRILSQSEIGKTVLMLRRKGTTWYLLALNGENEEKSISISADELAFLNAERVRTWSDKSKLAIAYEESTYKKNGIDLQLLPNGGAVIELLAAPNLPLHTAPLLKN